MSYICFGRMFCCPITSAEQKLATAVQMPDVCALGTGRGWKGWEGGLGRWGSVNQESKHSEDENLLRVPV